MGGRLDSRGAQTGRRLHRDLHGLCPVVANCCNVDFSRLCKTAYCKARQGSLGDPAAVVRNQDSWAKGSGCTSRAIGNKKDRPTGATQDLLARGAYIARGFKLKICLASDQSQVVAFDFSKEAFRRTPHDFEHFHRNASRPAMAFKCGQPTSSAGARIDKLRLVPNVLEARTAAAAGPASMNAGLVDDGHANEVGLLLARDLDRGQGRRFAARRTIDIDQDTLDHSSPPKHWACHWIGALFPEIRSPFLQLAWSSIQSHCNHPLKRR